MIKIDFDTITLELFKSFTAPVTFKLNQLGLTYLYGDNQLYPRLEANGVGKSALWQAIYWCLTGKVPTGTETLHSTDVRTRGSKGTTRVTLHLHINDKPEVLERSLSPNRLLHNGKEVGQDTFDRLVPIPSKVLAYTVIFGQERPLFLDLEPRKKMELLSDVLDLERWTERADKAGKAAAEERRKLDRLDARVVQLDNDLTQAEVWVKRAEEDVREWDTEHEAEKARVQARAETVRKELEEKTAAHDKADLAFESAATEAKALEAEVGKARGVWDQARQAGKPCRECGQPVVDRGKVERAEKALRKAEERAKTFRGRAEEAREGVLRLAPALGRLQGELKMLEASLAGFGSNPHRTRLYEARSHQRKLLQELDTLEADLNTTEDRFQRNSYWASTGFKTIKLHLVEDLLNELQLMTVGLLEDVGLLGWQIVYTIERETKSGNVAQGLTVMIKPPHEEAVRWASFSGGEAQRLRLVGALALSAVLLNHAGVQVNLLALDEHSQFLSEAGVNDLCETLANYARATNTSVWLVDHHCLSNPNFDQTVCVVRDKRGVHLECNGGLL